MKTPLRISLYLAMLFFSIHDSFAQCGAGTFYGSITVTTSWQNTASGGAGVRPYWSFTATAGETYNLSMCNGTAEDSYLYVYNSAWTLVASNDDSGPYCCCGGYLSSLDWVCGTTGTYYVLMASYPCNVLIYNQILSYKKVIPASAPSNDNCAGAISLTVNSSCVYTAGTSSGATQTLAGCNGNADDDVWYKFLATATTATVTVVPNASYDAAFEVRTGACNGTALNCTDGPGNGGTETYYASGLTVGATYYIRVWDFNAGAGGGGTFNICVYSPCAPPATPTTATFGSSSWNVYCYTGGSLDLTGCTYSGYYTEAALSYDSQNKWSNLVAPSSAAGYSGCVIPIDYHTVIYKRQDFTCGKYQLDIPAHDDDIRVYVNGAQVFEHIGCCDVHTNIWTGYLTTGSTIEVRHAEYTGGSQQSLTITNVTPAIVNGSLTINGVAANTNICTGSTITVAQGTGGSFPEATYYYWLGAEDPAGSGWVTAWAIWNGAYANTATPPSPPVFNTPGRYVVHTNAINNTCGWGYYGAGTTRYVDVIGSPAAPTSATASPATICLGSSSTLTTSGGLAAYYTFNNTLNDASGNGLHLTGSGGTLSAAGLQLTTASSYVSVPTEILNSDKYTLDFYMQYTAAADGTWRKIFGYTPTGSDRSPGLWKYPAAMQMHWRHDPGNTGLSEAKVYTQGQWYHVVGEKNGATLTIYVDGVQVEQGTVANPKTAGLSTLWFGGAPVLLKEFKIYNGVFRWYTGSCGGTLAGSGPTISVTPAATTTYYVREEGICGNTGCASVVVTVTAPTGTNAGGPDQYICTGLTTATMAGTGTGTWTQVTAYAGTITSPTSPTTTITGLASGTTYVFRWTTGCGYDDVVIITQ